MTQVHQLLPRRHPQSAAYVALREHLVDARKRAGITQRDLADRLGRPQSFVAKYEVGERFLDAVELVAIAALLDVDLVAIQAEVLTHLQSE